MNRAAQLEHAKLLRRALDSLRTSQRGNGRALPPEPSADDRALAATSTPAERERVTRLLMRRGFTRADVERGELLSRAALNDAPGNDTSNAAPGVDPDPVDAVTRARARQLRRGRS